MSTGHGGVPAAHSVVSDPRREGGGSTSPPPLSVALRVRVSWGQRLVASPLRQGEIQEDDDVEFGAFASHR
jgi:hypothetical protein